MVDVTTHDACKRFNCQFMIIKNVFFFRDIIKIIRRPIRIWGRKIREVRLTRVDQNVRQNTDTEKQTIRTEKIL